MFKLAALLLQINQIYLLSLEFIHFYTQIAITKFFTVVLTFNNKSDIFNSNIFVFN